ncbi:MAG TPA: phosphopantetheine-binding protein [Candidatus Babeliales bacterium]|nr:phosphopantetheine-binding protein [Candidatus Babeliales bacterium]
MSLIDPNNLKNQTDLMDLIDELDLTPSAVELDTEAPVSPRQLELEQQVVKIIIDQLKSAELWRDASKNKLDFDKHFFDLGLEQLDLFEIIIKLEDQFKLEIPDDEGAELTNINNIVDYLLQQES